MSRASSWEQWYFNCENTVADAKLITEQAQALCTEAQIYSNTHKCNLGDLPTLRTHIATTTRLFQQLATELQIIKSNNSYIYTLRRQYGTKTPLPQPQPPLQNPAQYQTQLRENAKLSIKLGKEIQSFRQKLKEITASIAELTVEHDSCDKILTERTKYVIEKKFSTEEDIYNMASNYHINNVPFTFKSTNSESKELQQEKQILATTFMDLCTKFINIKQRLQKSEELNQLYKTKIESIIQERQQLKNDNISLLKKMPSNQHSHANYTNQYNHQSIIDAYSKKIDQAEEAALSILKNIDENLEIITTMSNIIKQTHNDHIRTTQNQQPTPNQYQQPTPNQYHQLTPNQYQHQYAFMA